VVLLAVAVVVGPSQLSGGLTVPIDRQNLYFSTEVMCHDDLRSGLVSL
jgi:hypothetical protein